MTGCRSRAVVLTLVSRRYRGWGKGCMRRRGRREVGRCRWGRYSFRCVPPRGCGRRSGELGGVVEVRREGRQEVVFGSRRRERGRITVTSLCLLSVGGPVGEGTQNINRQYKTRRPSMAKTSFHLKTDSIFLYMNEP